MAMAVAKHHLLLLLSLLLVDLTSGDPAGEPTAYEMLERFGFPKGILPEGVTGYSLQRSDGAFEVFLERECEFEVDGGYRLRYQRKITGKVGPGSLRELAGVRVRIFMMRWGIDTVVRDNAGLRFYVGPISETFPADSFEESPRCGFNCRGGAGGIVEI